MVCPLCPDPLAGAGLPGGSPGLQAWAAARGSGPGRQPGAAA